MKAAQIKKYNQTLAVTIQEIDRPQPLANEVLVKVAYAAVNPLDPMNIRGDTKLMQNYALPLTLGNEIAGEITAIGTDVTDFKVGDQVYARLPLAKIGGFAEYVAVTTDAIWYTPKDLSLREAVAIPLTGLTAYQGLFEELAAEPNAVYPWWFRRFRSNSRPNRKITRLNRDCFRQCSRARSHFEFGC